MTTINEIAPDLFRLSIYVPDFDMQFNHFLVRDLEPVFSLFPRSPISAFQYFIFSPRSLGLLVF